MKSRRLMTTLAVTLCGLAAAATPLQAGTVSDFLKDAVYSYQNGALQPYDVSQLGGVKFFAFYYAGHWSTACSRYTPELVDFYTRAKKNHPEFEVIFVSEDHSRDEMLSYMKMAKMSWLATEYHKVPQQVVQYAGKYIPCLVVVDENGKMLSTSYEGERDLGPGQVVEDLEKRLRKFKNSAGSNSTSGSGFDDFFKKPAAPGSR
jgi:hypothetical protein